MSMITRLTVADVYPLDSSLDGGDTVVKNLPFPA